MHNSIFQELEFRIENLKKAERQINLSDEERNCIRSRVIELESMKEFVNGRYLLDKQQRRRLTNQEFWRLIDDF